MYRNNVRWSRPFHRFTFWQSHRGYVWIMVDQFALALSHALLLVAAWRLLMRPDLDVEEPDKPASRPRR